MSETPATRALRLRAEQITTQREVDKILKQAREKERMELLTFSLQQQGKVAPIVTRDDTGRKITKWIGSPKGFLGPFMEPPKKATLDNVSYNERQRRARDREREFFEQAGRDALKPQPSPPPSDGQGPPRQGR